MPVHATAAEGAAHCQGGARGLFRALVPLRAARQRLPK